jgi:uncharacterized protein YycO
MSETVTLIYRRSYTIGSILIRLASWFGPYSHVGAITPDGKYVIEATISKGVTKTTLSEFEKKSSKSKIVLTQCPNPDKFYQFLEDQIGKPYDWGSIFGIVSREKWDSPDKWQCAELIEVALKYSGRCRFRREVHRITVDQSYIVK